jgi:hypothetical protein
MVKELREEERRRKMYDASSHLDLDPESAAAEIQRIFRGTQMCIQGHVGLRGGGLSGGMDEGRGG